MKQYYIATMDGGVIRGPFASREKANKARPDYGMGRGVRRVENGVWSNGRYEIATLEQLRASGYTV